MAQNSNRAQNPTASKIPANKNKSPAGILWLARACLVGAIGGAGGLLFYTLTEKPMAGCGPGSPCDKVMGSSWAYWLEIPVSAPALLAYLSLLVCSFAVASKSERNATRAWNAGFLLSLLILASAGWFTYLQLAILKSICKYCTASHALSVVGAVIFLFKAPRPKYITIPRRVALVGAALLIFGSLIAGQKLAPHKINIVSIYDGTFNFDLREVPLIGSRDSKTFIISLFDYTCPDCRDMHGHLKKAREYFTNSFSIISLPVPLDSRCNPLVKETHARHKEACDYARIGLAVRHCGLAEFQKYDDWFFSARPIPSVDAARKEAQDIAGLAAFEKAATDPSIDTMIRKAISIYEQNARNTKSGQLPQVIVGDTVNIGPARDSNELIGFLKERLPTAASINR